LDFGSEGEREQISDGSARAEAVRSSATGGFWKGRDAERCRAQPRDANSNRFSTLWSAVIGFAVAFVQAGEGEGLHLLWTAIVFLLLMVVCGVVAFTKRRKLKREAKRIRFRLGDPIEEPPR
jgi:hypothetical protein